MRTTLHAASALQERGFFVIFGLLGLFISLITYAVLVNAALGKEFGVRQLTVSLTKLEGERAKHQALLGQTSAALTAETEQSSLSAVGNDFSYIHPNDVFVDAGHLRP